MSNGNLFLTKASCLPRESQKYYTTQSICTNSILQRSKPENLHIIITECQLGWELAFQSPVHVPF